MLQQNAIWIVSLAAYCGLLLWAAVTDYRHYLIPNQASLGALALYPLYVVAAPHAVPWMLSLGIAVAFFVIGFGLWAMRIMGGGDAKLLPVAILWVEPAQIGNFIFAFALASLVLALAVGMRAAAAKAREEAAAAPGGGVGAQRVLGNLRYVNFWKLQMPYGVAIAAGGIFVAINAVFTVLR